MVNAQVIVNQTVKQSYELPCLEISEGTITATERRLYHLPEACARLNQSEGLERLLLEQEVRTVKSALQDISTDPFYAVIPGHYFQQAVKGAAIAQMIGCDKVTAWRHRKRLLLKLTERLYGVTAWARTRKS